MSRKDEPISDEVQQDRFNVVLFTASLTTLIICEIIQWLLDVPNPDAIPLYPLWLWGVAVVIFIAVWPVLVHRIREVDYRGEYD